MPAPIAVILAAGQGTRMRSVTPKMLHPICGRPMVLWPVQAALEAGVGKVVVVGGPDRALEGMLPRSVELAVQAEPRGTGDAVRAAAPHMTDPDATVLVLNGDVPLITADVLRGLLDAHGAAGAQATVTTMVLADPSGYGRVIRAPDGTIARIVETKHPGDATAEELAVDEVNAGVYAFAAGGLAAALERLTADNAQGEEYLPDALLHLEPVRAHLVDDPSLTLGINDRVDLATVTRLAQARIHEQHQRAGVTIVDPASTVIEAGVELGADTVVEPFTSLKGSTRAGADCRIGPLTTVIDATLGDGVVVVHSYLDRATLHRGATVGPFAYLRPDAVLYENAKAGTFVEIKNSEIGEGTKVPHLSYIGDADVGPGTNLGAATITANYDGQRKHRTTIGARVRTSVDTTLVAPVTVGDDAYTAAGSVITEDVPPGALGIARERQTNIANYAEKRAKR
ncbi:MAG TPA: bifunctional UDP-N-acetylglucosamine diphosphorylase/glucosamine-1-phosphate N-acetyltransferase GlmU [Solirubrobacteraceae bacterium]|jgi:bifunctional UDP-N-acetylglucosamine pyrophosphorylase/glucosamine-1-phosphate N-acetyltransferase